MTTIYQTLQIVISAEPWSKTLVYVGSKGARVDELVRERQHEKKKSLRFLQMTAWHDVGATTKEIKLRYRGRFQLHKIPSANQLGRLMTRV